MKKSRLLGTSMFLRTLLFLLVLLPVSQAQAAAVITLTATTSENAPGGYLPGTVVDFDATITQDTASAIEVRLAQLDFAASDSMLTFLGDFNFDFSTLFGGDALYATFPSYPPPGTVYTSISPIPGFILEIPPAGGSLLLGSGQVQLPATTGVFMLDALNASTADPNRGAQILFGFTGTTTWSAPNGLITGSPLALTAVPIPASVWLFGFGLLGLIGIARRKKA